MLKRQVLSEQSHCQENIDPAQTKSPLHVDNFQPQPDQSQKIQKLAHLLFQVDFD